MLASFVNDSESHIKDLEEEILAEEGRVGQATHQQKRISKIVGHANNEAKAVFGRRDIPEMDSIWAYVRDQRELLENARIYEITGGSNFADKYSKDFFAKVAEGELDIGIDRDQEYQDRSAEEKKHATEYQVVEAILITLDSAHTTAYNSWEEASGKFTAQESRLRDAKSTERNLEAGVSDAESNLRSNNTKLKTAERELESAEGVHERAKEKLSAWLDGKYKSAQDSLAGKRAEMESLTIKLRDARAEVETRRRLLFSADQAKRRAETDLRIAQTQVADTRDQQTREIKDRDWHKSQNTEWGKRRVTELQASIDKREGVIADLVTAEASAKAQLQTAETNFTSAQSSVTQQEKIILKLEGASHSLAPEIRSIDDSLRGKGRDSLREEKDAKEQEIRRLDNEVGRLKRAKDDALRLVTQSQRGLEESNARLVEYQTTTLAKEQAALESSKQAVELSRISKEAALTELNNYKRQIPQDKQSGTRRMQEAVFDSLKRSYEADKVNLENPVFYNAFVRGFAARLRERHPNPPYPESIVIKINNKEIPVWVNGSEPGPLPEPGLPEVVISQGENSVAIIKQAITERSFGYKEQLEEALKKAEHVPGIEEEIQEEAIRDNRTFNERNLELKQTEIAEVQKEISEARSAGRSQGNLELKLSRLPDALKSWERQRLDVTRVAEQLKNAEARLTQLQKDLIGLPEPFANFTDNQKERTKRRAEVLTDINSLMDPKTGQGIISRTRTQLEQLRTAFSLATQEVKNLYPEALAQERRGDALVEVRVLNDDQIRSMGYTASTRSREAQSRVDALQKVEKAWTAGKMLDYTKPETEFATAIADIDYAKGKRETNTLDFLAKDLFSSVISSVQRLHLDTGAEVTCTIDGSTVTMDQEGKKVGDVALTSRYWGSLNQLRSSKLQQEILNKVFTEQSDNLITRRNLPKLNFKFKSVQETV